MKRTHVHCHVSNSQNRSLLLLLLLLLASGLFLFLFLSLTLSPSTRSRSSEFSYESEAELAQLPSLGLPGVPRLAYMISGSRGDARRVWRILRAAYHPRNHYVVHLDLEASDEERLEVARLAGSEAAMREFGNVMVVGRANLVTPKGPTVIASTLHAVAILLRKSRDWDWFVNLGASDYPLLAQDGTLFFFLFFFFFHLKLKCPFLMARW